MDDHIDAKGIPVSDWAWWVGDAESVAEEGLYNLYEAATREGALEWAEAYINPGDRFHIIEARCRVLQADDEYQPFAASRNHAEYLIDDAGTAIEVPAAHRTKGTPNAN